MTETGVRFSHGLLIINLKNQPTNMELIVALLGVVGIVALIFLYDAFSWGYVFLKTYTWFILPVFTGLPVVTFHEAIGICIFLTLFKNHSSQSYEGLKKKVDWSSFIMAPWIVLVIAFMMKSLLQ